MDLVLNTNDLLLLILNYATNTGKSYKTCREVCINWQKLCDLHFDHRVDQYSNHLLTLMDKIPELQLYFFNISTNPNISWQYICDHPEYNWDWNLVIQNPNVDWNIVKHYLLDKVPHENMVLNNHNITEDVIESTSFGETKINWNWYNISCNTNITYKFIKENPQYHWNYGCIIMHHDFTEREVENIITYHNLNPEYYIYYRNATWDRLKNYANEPWKILWISCHPNVTWDIIIQNPQINWNWNGISRNPNITWDIIKQNPDYPWVHSQFSLNPNLTWKIVINNPQINWDWYLISMNVFNKVMIKFMFINSRPPHLRL